MFQKSLRFSAQFYWNKIFRKTIDFSCLDVCFAKKDSGMLFRGSFMDAEAVHETMGLSIFFNFLFILTLVSYDFIICLRLPL